MKKKMNYTPPMCQTFGVNQKRGLLAGMSLAGDFDEVVNDGGDAEYVGDIFLR